MLYHQLPTSSHYLHAFPPRVKKFPIFTEPYGLLSSLQKPVFGSYILDQLNLFHNVPMYPLQNVPIWSYSLTFSMHMLNEFIIEALLTTCPISHVLDSIALIMLARSYVFFILLISSLSWTRIFN